MNKDKILTVVAVSEVKQDNGQMQQNRNYKTITFSTPEGTHTKDELTGEILKIKMKPKKSSINVYEKSYLDNEMEFGYDFEVGDKIYGDIVTRPVKPYTFKTDKGTQTAYTYTMLVQGETSSPDFERKVEETFKKVGKEIEKQTPLNFSIAKKSSLDQVAEEVKEKEKVL